MRRLTIDTNYYAILKSLNRILAVWDYSPQKSSIRQLWDLKCCKIMWAHCLPSSRKNSDVSMGQSAPLPEVVKDKQNVITLCFSLEAEFKTKTL